jgi:neutral ceramidase
LLKNFLEIWGSIMRLKYFLGGIFGVGLLFSSTNFAGMKAGFAERDITPAKGMEVPGGYGKVFNDGNVHDPLKVRAAVFDDGGSRVALVGIDAGSLAAHVVAEARTGIQRACGIPPQAVLVGASHVHSGGPSEGVVPGEFDHASKLVQWLAYEKSLVENSEYRQKILRALVETVVEADHNKVLAKLGIGRGQAEHTAFNRRFRMKNGMTFTHPNDFRTIGNPDIMELAGPVDSEVGVIGAWDSSGQFLGCVVNYANHATNGAENGAISADYIYYLEKTIRGVMGEKAGLVFLNGACGDVTQVDNRSPDSREFGSASARYVGTSVAAEALKVLTKAEPGDLAPISFKSEILRIPRRKPSADRVRKSMELVQQPEASVDATSWTFAKELVLLDDLIKREPVASVEVQAIQIGPAVFLANPSEFFAQLGMNIKSRCKFAFPFVVELANGAAGYVPTEEAFGPHGGGYETRLTLWSNLEITAGRQIVDASLRLADSMKPGTVPEPPKKKPFKEAWSYGNVPPELN